MTGAIAGVMFATIAALANVAGGGLVLARRDWSQRSMKASLAFGGGFLLAAAVLAMAPEGLHLMPKWGPELILLGYLTVHFLEHVVGGHYHFAGDQHGPDRTVSTTVTGATMFAMLVHTFFDGVAIGSAFIVGRDLGLLVLFAVVLHKVPAGFAVSTVALASGAPRTRAFGAAALLGAGTIIGSLVVSAAGALAPYAVPISAGTLIHVAASDLIPEVNEGERWPITAAVVAGALLFLIVKALMGAHVH
jgi:ZIP family zinc transporter/zinc and cadmium transporter